MGSVFTMHEPEPRAPRTSGRRSTRWLLAAAASSALQACGGGQPTAYVAPPSPAPAVIAQAAPTPAESTQTFLDWAEQAYPQYFPGRQPDQLYDGVTYRHYSSTGNFVGVLGDRVLVMGPISDGPVIELGAIGDFGCLVSPRSCFAERPFEARQNRVAAGSGHTLVVNAQGAGLGWGDGLANVAGTELTGTPARAVGGLNQVAGLSSGNGFTLATTRDGQLLYLHHGAKHPLVRGADAGPTAAIPIATPGKVVASASCGQSGSVRTFLLHADGKLSTFTVDGIGLISPLATIETTTPFRAFGSHVSEVEPEDCGLRAIAADGGAWVVDNKDPRTGRLGAPRLRLDPATTTPLHDISCTGIAAVDHCLAVTGAGSLLAWGNNAAGQLGQNPSQVRSSPNALEMTGLPPLTRVWARAGASYALARDGAVYAWGSHIGPDASSPIHLPRRQFAGSSPIADMAISKHLVLLARDGGLHTWGNNTAAELGRGDRDPTSSLTRPVGMHLGTLDDVGMPPTGRIAALATSIFAKGSTITLSDGGSRDADGDVLLWQWSLSGKPEGSGATLTTPNSPTTRVTLDRPGTYSFSLVVSDGRYESQPASISVQVLDASVGAGPLPAPNATESAILVSRYCIACHALDRKIVGPSYMEIATRYRAAVGSGADPAAQLTATIMGGSSGRWGPVPMPPSPQLTAEELSILLNWLLVRSNPPQ